MQKSQLSILGIFIWLSLSGCDKYLDKNADKSKIIPSTIEDFKGLLNNNNIINNGGSSVAEAFADNYYLPLNLYTSITSESFRHAYIWGDLILEGEAPSSAWSQMYQVAYYGNIIIDGLKKIDKSDYNETDWNYCYGAAHFMRAHVFFEVISLWTGPYQKSTAKNQLGIPLRLNPDFNEQSIRSNLEESYEQVIADLKVAAQFLPVSVDHYSKTNKVAAYALLSRVFLAQGNYNKSKTYADSSLALYSRLINYNTLNSSVNFPFTNTTTNPNLEIIFYSQSTITSVLATSRAIIDTNLFNSYQPNDLRRSLYFGTSTNGTKFFKGFYSGNGFVYKGLTVDEVYLNRAESLIRMGSWQDGLTDLNHLLTTRWKTSTFIPFTAINQEGALNIVLEERRKSLVYRGLRWLDLKRLNQDPQRMVTIKRILGNETYVLGPNDPRYAALIPTSVIGISGMQQNPR